MTHPLFSWEVYQAETFRHVHKGLNILHIKTSSLLKVVVCPLPLEKVSVGSMTEIRNLNRLDEKTPILEFPDVHLFGSSCRERERQRMCVCVVHSLILGNSSDWW